MLNLLKRNTVALRDINSARRPAVRLVVPQKNTHATGDGQKATKTFSRRCELECCVAYLTAGIYFFSNYSPLSVDNL